MKHKRRSQLRSEDQRTETVACRDLSAWDQLLSETLIPRGRPKGDGWLTVAELAEKIDMTHNGALGWVRKMKRIKRIETAMGRHEVIKKPVLYVRPL